MYVKSKVWSDSMQQVLAVMPFVEDCCLAGRQSHILLLCMQA